MKTNSRIGVSIAIVLVGALYSFLLFALKKNLSLSEWIVYGFTILALVIALIWYCIRLGSVKEYPMFDRPLSRVVLIYCIAQFVLGGILGMVLPLPGEYTTLIIEIVALAAFVIIMVVLNSGMSSARRLDDKDYANVSDIRAWAVSAAAVKNELKDPALAARADQMVEALRYTDPSHIKETEGLERRIENNLNILRDDVEAGDTDRAQARMDKIIQLVKERSDMILALKK